MRTKDELLDELSRCVLEMEDDLIVQIAEEYASCEYDPLDGILVGLVKGMNQAAELYEQEEYFIPELLLCSETMYNALDILKPLLPKQNSKDKCRVVIGVVEGDTHDIGKNLVKVMLESAGYEIIDLGRDVPVERFVNTAQEEDAKIIALSTLMTTSMQNMRKVIEHLEEKGIRDNFKVVIGGGPISQGFADKIGADGYSTSAVEAVKLVNRLIGVA